MFCCNWTLKEKAKSFMLFDVELDLKDLPYFDAERHVFNRYKTTSKNGATLKTLGSQRSTWRGSSIKSSYNLNHGFKFQPFLLESDHKPELFLRVHENLNSSCWYT
jgi:hypothetical protein